MPIYNRLLAFMLKPWVLIAYPLVVVISILYFDKPIASYFFGLQLQNSFPPLFWFTKLGLGILYLPSFFMAALFFRYLYINRTWEARCWFIWLSVVTTSGFCVLLKVLLGRARPDLWFGYQLYGFYGFHRDSKYWSFPSGHTSTIMGLSFALAILFPRYGLGYMLFGFLVAISRVLLVQHYLSDIAVATWLSLMEIAVLYWILQKKQWLSEAWLQNDMNFIKSPAY